MIPLDPNSLFAQAERAFVEGRLHQAQRDLLALEQRVPPHPAILHLRALVEKRLGNAQAAELAFAKAMQLDPRNPEIATNAGNLFASQGRHDRALAAYEQALSSRPHFLGALRARAAALAQLGRISEARAAYQRAISLHPSDPGSWTGLGLLEREEGDLGAAAQALDRAIGLTPGAPRPLHARARVALERGETDAQERYAIVERLLPSDPQVALSAAEACVNVDPRRGLHRLEEVVARFQDLPEAHGALARLRWELGDQESFTATIEKRLGERPGNAELWQSLVVLLSGVGRHADAADAAARASRALPDDTRFPLLEAANASEAGDLDRAERLFALLQGLPGTVLAEARHRIKTCQLDRAEALLHTVRSQDPGSVVAWSLSGILWRAREDPRAEWLYQQERLVRTLPLQLSATRLGAIAAEIRSLHHASAFPIGQSLRGGTQTRGRLLERPNPAVLELRSTILETLHTYWRALPPKDETHPLLKHRDRELLLAGSWSVRLTDGGCHVPHIHSEGILSSACYLHLPSFKVGEGHLELGGGPRDICSWMEPLITIKPEEGQLALFPSFMFHATAPFATGERLTVAFDVVVRT